MPEPFDPNRIPENWRLDPADPLRLELDELDRALNEVVSRHEQQIYLPEMSRLTRTRRRRRAGWVGGGIAAAAIAAAVLLAGPSGQPTATAVPLDVKADRPFVVFQTDNPNLAIVWLLAEEEIQP